MPPPKNPIFIQERLFTRGKTTCPVCEHKFKYLLPMEILPFWDNYCATCTLAYTGEALKPGQIVIEVLGF